MKNEAPVDYKFTKTGYDTHRLTYKMALNHDLVRRSIAGSMKKFNIDSDQEKDINSRIEILPQFYNSLYLAFRRTTRTVIRLVESKGIFVTSQKIVKAYMEKPEGSKEWVIEVIYEGVHSDER